MNFVCSPRIISPSSLPTLSIGWKKIRSDHQQKSQSNAIFRRSTGRGDAKNRFSGTFRKSFGPGFCPESTQYGQVIIERESASDLEPRASRAQKPAYEQGNRSGMLGDAAVFGRLAGFHAFARGTRAVPGTWTKNALTENLKS